MKDEERRGVNKSMEEDLSDGAIRRNSSNRGRSSSTGRSASGSRFLGRSNSGSQSRRKGSKKSNYNKYLGQEDEFMRLLVRLDTER